ncbi:hypothetical protein SOVF_198370 [Spinacia oleracea]|nr:hypothetical protein SOVF_198370 [Spinacia oleracea]
MHKVSKGAPEQVYYRSLTYMSMEIIYLYTFFLEALEWRKERLEGPWKFIGLVPLLSADTFKRDLNNVVSVTITNGVLNSNAFCLA